VVWYDDRDGNHEIYYKKYDGVSWGPDTRLTTSSGISEFPAVCVDLEDRIHVVWADKRDGNYEVYYKEYDGVGWSSDQRLTVSGGASRHPSIAAAGDGNPHVVYQDDTGGGPTIRYRSHDGSTWLPEESIAPSIEGSATPTVAVDGMNRVHVLWYQDSGSGDHLYYKRCDGGVWGDVVDLAARNLIYGPTITTDTDNNVHVAWHDRRYGEAWGYEVFYRKFDGFEWEPEIQITDAVLSSHNASLATDSEGTVYLAWADKRTGDNEIYYAKDTGSGWGANVRLTRSDGESRLPSLVASQAGVLHLVWKDLRDGNAEIYYKKRGLDELAGLETVESTLMAPCKISIAPNPMRTATEIRFDLAPTEPCDLEVFDIKGRLISRIALREPAPVTQSVMWDGSDITGNPVAPGVYFVRLKARNGVRSTKVVLIK
jgi:hypothetical protein